MSEPKSDAALHLSKSAVVRGAGVVALARLGAAIEAVSQPAFTWMFGLATYGIYTALWAAVNIISNVADFAMTSAMQRTIPQSGSEEQAHSAFKTAIVVGIVPSIVIAAFLSLFAEPAAAMLNAAPRDRATLVTAVALFAWALPLWTFVELATSGVRARKAFGPEVRLRIFWEQIVRLVLAGAAWLAGWMTLGLIVAHLVSLAVTAALAVRLIARYYDLKLLLRVPIDRAVVRDLMQTGLGILPANIAQRLFSDLPPLLLNLLLPGAAGASAAGLFGIARKVASLPLIVRHSLYYVIQPLAAAQAAHDPSHINPVFGFASRLSMILLLPMALMLGLLADQILLLFPPEASAAAPLLVILTTARGVNAIAGPANGILQMLRPRFWPTANAVIGLACWAVVTQLLRHGDAAQAMAWGVAGGLFAMEWLALTQLWFTDRLHPFDPPFWRGLLTIGLAAAAIIVLARMALNLPVPAYVASVVILCFALVWLALRTALTVRERGGLGRVGVALRLHRAPAGQ